MWRLCGTIKDYCEIISEIISEAIARVSGDCLAALACAGIVSIPVDRKWCDRIPHETLFDI